MHIKRMLGPFLLGMLAGMALLAAFRFVLPLIESAAARHSGVHGSAEIVSVLEASVLVNACYVLAWILVVFGSAYTAARIDGEARSIPALCAGGVYLAAFSANVEFLLRQPLFYLVFLVVAGAALLLAAGMFARPSGT